jgi:hypothetical protein
VPPLDDRYLTLLVKEGQPVASIVNDEPENSESLWYTEFVKIRVELPLHGHLIVGVQHHELQLNIVCDEWGPNTFCFLLKLNVKFDVILQLVVLWVRALADIWVRALLSLLVVPEVAGT